ncbi:uncharacterized protein J7T54_005848 [Emericellopsis cladophorae]|uniref:BZIP domain-containing protein n=1 Tax=Emericellopsis cladophorae TaxID=2686198 RepID=A0A9Q0BBQ6_9HYPO|nr:uncharacterized protein J7T54_005848 [Emericellopsis cladophorae]KAI6778745.1 hypothetical protein J7T54_005848 [Emericellopsis cladophorae]
MASQTPKKRAVDLLTADQLRRKREGDKTAQRQRRERIRVQIELLQDQVAELRSRNRLLEEQLAKSIAPPAVINDTACKPGDTTNSVPPALVTAEQVALSGDKTSTSPAYASATSDSTFWSASDSNGTLLTDLDDPTPAESADWEEDLRLRPSIFQVLNENPLGFGFTVWSEPDFMSDNGLGGLPVEYAATVESASQRGKLNVPYSLDKRKNNDSQRSAYGAFGNLRNSDCALGTATAHQQQQPQLSSRFDNSSAQIEQKIPSNQ